MPMDEQVVDCVAFATIYYVSSTHPHTVRDSSTIYLQYIHMEEYDLYLHCYIQSFGKFSMSKTGPRCDELANPCKSLSSRIPLNASQYMFNWHEVCHTTHLATFCTTFVALCTKY
jgi:hypothetical protein